MDQEDAELSLDHMEAEGIEDEVGTEPHVFRPTNVGIRPERLFTCRAKHAVGAIGSDHKVVVGGSSAACGASLRKWITAPNSTARS